jgi:hypothetical protein
MPPIDLDIGHSWEHVSRKVLRERLACLRMLQVPVLHGILDVGNMFLWPKKDLY